MWTLEEYQKSLAGQSNQELFDILSRSDDYRPEAIGAVRAELQKRNLSESNKNHLERGAKLKIALDAREVDQPLTFWMWIFSFISSGLAGAGLVVALHYSNAGMKQKAKDAWIAWGCGLCFWFLVYTGFRL